MSDSPENVGHRKQRSRTPAGSSTDAPAAVRRESVPEKGSNEEVLDGGGRASSQWRDLVEGLLRGSDPEAMNLPIRRIKKGVYRAGLEEGRTPRSVILKRLNPQIGHRNAVVASRWLPAGGLQDAGPVLLRTVAEPQGRFVWHVYEDFGEASLQADPVEPNHLEDSVGLVASLHRRFARHPLLGECRLWGGDLGMSYYHANVVDAIRALESLDSPAVGLGTTGRAARKSLLATLREMLDDEGRRRSLSVRHGGPETLLHGDLWRQNVMLVQNGEGRLRPRLIDWDHAGVGQISYDLSTLLSRFPKHERQAVLDLYRAHIAAAGWPLPGNEVLNECFDTAERSRIANRVIWPAIQLRLDGHTDWAVEQLIEIRRWFERLEPVLP